MPEQFNITGPITLPEGVDHAGINVQVFDHDLPCLEYHMVQCLRWLGEMMMDTEGDFKS